MRRTRRRAPSPRGPASAPITATGYSIGINYPPDWGEGEIISLRQEEHRPMVAGMTFHMPLLCLKYREFGIGFSESIEVTETGCRRLSTLPAEIVIKH